MEEHALSQSGPGLPPETWREQFVQVLTLSVPAILAQISSMAMQYIDAAMVGSLGARASASIGLVSTSTWLLGGLCSAAATGFAVQVAHRIGAGQDDRAGGDLHLRADVDIAACNLDAVVQVFFKGFGIPAFGSRKAFACSGLAHGRYSPLCLPAAGRRPAGVSGRAAMRPAARRQGGPLLCSARPACTARNMVHCVMGAAETVFRRAVYMVV